MNDRDLERRIRDLEKQMASDKQLLLDYMVSYSRCHDASRFLKSDEPDE